LDIDEHSEKPELPSKLFKFSSNNTSIFFRDDSRMGLKSISVEDGTELAHMKDMHKKKILDFVLLQDQTTIITASKDKTIKVWDILSQTMKEKLEENTGIVTCLCLDPSEKYMFSASYDLKIIVWYIPTWTKLCYFKSDIEVDFLSLTLDNSFLLATHRSAYNEMDAHAYWRI